MNLDRSEELLEKMTATEVTMDALAQEHADHWTCVEHQTKYCRECFIERTPEATESAGVDLRMITGNCAVALFKEVVSSTSRLSSLFNRRTGHKDYNSAKRVMTCAFERIVRNAIYVPSPPDLLECPWRGPFRVLDAGSIGEKWFVVNGEKDVLFDDLTQSEATYLCWILNREWEARK